MRRRMSLLAAGLLLIVQILQGFAFAGVASADDLSNGATTVTINDPSGGGAGNVDDPAGSSGTASDGTSSDGTGTDGTDQSGDGTTVTDPDPDAADPDATDPDATDPDAVDPDAAVDSDESADLAALDAVEPTRPAAEIQDQVVTNVTMKIKNAQGTYEDWTPAAVYEQGSQIELNYDWALPYGTPDDPREYVSGDWFTFALPDKFVLSSDLSGDLNFDGLKVAEYTIERSTMKVKVVFNEWVEEFEKVKGNIQVQTKFDKSKFSGGTDQEILFPISGTEVKSFVVKFKPTTTPAMSKEGEIIGNSFNADRIKWTVDFNQAKSTVENAVLTDSLPSGLQLDEASLKVYKLEVQLDGKVVPSATALGLNTDYTIGKTGDGKDFTLNFNSSTIDSAYRVVYETAVMSSGTTFANTAVLSGSNGVNLSASDSVSITRGKLLDKVMTKYNAQAQQVDWKIYYNYSGQTFAPGEAVLKDLFNGSQELVEAVKVYRVSPTKDQDETGKTELTAGFTVNEITDEGGKNGFTLTFNDQINSAYVIQYSTRSTNPVYQNSSDSDNNIVNVVTEQGGTSASANVSIGQVFGIKSYVGDKDDYVNKTVDWKIVLNNNKLTMKDINVKDTFPNDGLTLLPGSVAITSLSGTVLKVGPDYILNPIDDAKGYSSGFEIQFRGSAATITDEYTITYKTAFDPDQLKTGTHIFKNKAVVNWNDQDGINHEITTSADFVPNDKTKNDETLNNGYKFGEYNATTKKISWTVGVNFNKKSYPNASIVDTLTSGQKLVEDSLKVYNMKINANGTYSNGTLVSPTDATSGYDVAYDEATGKLVVTFKETITTGYVLTFDTNFEGLLIESNKIDNTANLLSGTTPVSKDLKADVTINKAGEYVDKTGAQDGEVMNWKIWINRGQSTLDQIQLTDKPSANQILLQDSFKLYRTTVAKDGAVTKATGANALLKRGEEYTLTFATDAEGKESFVLEFTDGISVPYLLEYQSLIDANDGDSVSNSIDFSGYNSKTVSDHDDGSAVVAVSSGSGSASGVRYQLTMHKVDAADENLSLKGAEFTLQRKMKSGALLDIGTGVTDQNGLIVFTKLLSGNYILKETKAPEGYKIDTVNHPVEINSSNAEALNVNTTVKNQRGYKLIVKKVDKDDSNMLLQGAKFTLEYKKQDGTRVNVGNGVTDQNGQVAFDKLLAGEYVLTENSSPTHYVLDPIEHAITLNLANAGDDLILEQEIGNERMYGLTVHKVDADIPTLSLAGAEFTLSRKEADGTLVTIATKTSDADGLAEFENLLVGNYVLQETAAPTGYALDEAKHEITISRDAAGSDFVVDQKISNEKTYGLTVHKVDKDDNTLSLAGAEFTLSKKEADGTLVTIATKTSDAAGLAKFENLLAGEYVLQETEAPVGYALDEAEHPITISRDAADSDFIFDQQIDNEKTYGLHVHKVAADDASLPVEGAEFTLSHKQADGTFAVVATKTSDAAGLIKFEDLLAGSYVLQETKAPTGYVLDETEYPIEINRTDAGSDFIVDKEIGNVKTYGLTVHKVDTDNTLRSLEGAEFALSKKQADGTLAAIATKTSDAAGLIKFEDLLAGDYVLQETKAPTGYLLDTTKHEVTISRSEAGSDFVVDQEVGNKRIPYVPGPPVTTDPTPTPTPPTPTTPTTPTSPTPTPTVPGILIPLINVPEEGTPSGGIQVDPTPVVPTTPTTPVTPSGATPTPTPDNDINIDDETPRGGLDVPSDPANPADPTDPTLDSPDDSVPQGTVPVSGDLLPQTGESDQMPIRALGFGLLLIGLLGFLFVRRRAVEK